MSTFMQRSQSKFSCFIWQVPVNEAVSLIFRLVNDPGSGLHGSGLMNESTHCLNRCRVCKRYFISCRHFKIISMVFFKKTMLTAFFQRSFFARDPRVPESSAA